MELTNIIRDFEKRVPKALQEKWDHCGLNLGNSKQNIQSVLFSYDICKEVIDYAKKKKCQLIVSHHPFRMSAQVSLDLSSYEGQLIEACIKNNIALYCSHTNHDSSQDSLNFHYLKKLKLQNIQALTPAPIQLLKIVVFVPQTHTIKVMEALFDAGAGHIGNYSDCSFRTSGTGSFKGNEFTNPAIGKKFVLEEVQEDKVETIVKENDLSKVLQAMKASHPYEEVAYDIYPLQNKMPLLGLGAIGSHEKGITKPEILKLVQKIFRVKNIRFVNTHKKTFHKIAICTGSGASLMDAALAQKADLFITGDVKYHQAIHAKRHDLALIDVGHFHSEKDSVVILQKIFAELFANKLKYYIYNDLKDAFEFV